MVITGHRWHINDAETNVSSEAETTNTIKDAFNIKPIRRKAIKTSESKTGEKKLSKCDKNEINIVKPLVFDVWCIVDSVDESLVDCIFCRVEYLRRS